MLTVRLNSLTNFTPKERALVAQGARIAEEVMNSQEFHDEILAMRCTETHGLSNQMIYASLMSGKETAMDAPDDIVDVSYIMYHKPWSKVVGYVMGTPKFQLWVNRKFFMNAASIASNLVHEYAHRNGFRHDGVFATSVPYTLNRIVMRVWGQIKNRVTHA